MRSVRALGRAGGPGGEGDEGGRLRLDGGHGGLGRMGHEILEARVVPAARLVACHDAEGQATRSGIRAMSSNARGRLIIAFGSTRAAHAPS